MRSIVKSALILLAIAAAMPAQAKTDLLEPFREVRVDPASLAPEGRTYRVGDLVLRAFLRLPATTRIEEDRTVDLNGFQVTLPKDTMLTQKAFVRAPTVGLFGDGVGPGTGSVGAVFCTADRLALGPFTSGKKLSPFKALACLLDSNLDGVFEAVTFIGFFSAREAGPVAMKPLAYRVAPGEFVPEERVELSVQKFGGKYLYLKALLYTRVRSHAESEFRMYVDDFRGNLIDYSDSCRTELTNGARSSNLLGARFTIDSFDPSGATFQASLVAPSRPVTAYVSPDQLIFDWIPAMMGRCG